MLLELTSESQTSSALGLGPFEYMTVVSWLAGEFVSGCDFAILNLKGVGVTDQHRKKQGICTLHKKFMRMIAHPLG